MSKYFLTFSKSFLGFDFFEAGAIGGAEDWMENIQKEDLVPLFNEHDNITLDTTYIKLDKYQQKLTESGVTLFCPEKIILWSHRIFWQDCRSLEGENV